jgi:hypothetical protein
MIYVWDLFGVECDVKTNAGGEEAKKLSTKSSRTNSNFMSCVLIK